MTPFVDMHVSDLFDGVNGDPRFIKNYIDAHGGAARAVIEMDNYSMVQEVGLNLHYPIGEDEAQITHNGQHRLEIKAWKGCPSFETFQAETDNPT